MDNPLPYHNNRKHRTFVLSDHMGILRLHCNMEKGRLENLKFSMKFRKSFPSPAELLIKYTYPFLIIFVNYTFYYTFNVIYVLEVL